MHHVSHAATQALTAMLLGVAYVSLINTTTKLNCTN